MHDFVLTIDGTDYHVNQITCITNDCGQYRYEVTSAGSTCTVMASLDGGICMSGCLDPDTRQVACSQLRQEIEQAIRAQHPHQTETKSMSKLHVSWNDISRLCYQIAKQVSKPTHVVALSRGGLTPGVMLSHHWDVPMIPLQWSTRDHAHQELGTASRILSLLSQDPLASILIVDDIGDTGESLATLTDFLYNHQVENVHQQTTTACLYLKAGCRFQPDVYGAAISDPNVWVVFPFEEPLATK